MADQSEGGEARRFSGTARKYKRYNCPEEKITGLIMGWYAENHTSAAELWPQNRRGHLMREKDHVRLRAKMIYELCVFAPEDMRISPLDIAKDASIPHSSAFAISERVSKQDPRIDRA